MYILYMYINVNSIKKSHVSVKLESYCKSGREAQKYVYDGFARIMYIYATFFDV